MIELILQVLGLLSAGVAGWAGAKLHLSRKRATTLPKRP